MDLVAEEKEEGGPLGTGVAEGCEPSFECWESNLGLQEVKPVVFTMVCSIILKDKIC